MRPIKFRAWHKIQKEMLWKLYLTFEGKIGIWTNDESEIDFDSNYPYLELMQFTGLKDKNGVEIYEGDIVETNYGKSIIEWNLKTARWEQQLFHSSLDSERCSLMDWNKGIKVIGNIHEERSET